MRRLFRAASARFRTELRVGGGHAFGGDKAYVMHLDIGALHLAVDINEESAGTTGAFSLAVGFPRRLTDADRYAPAAPAPACRRARSGHTRSSRRCGMPRRARRRPG